MTFIKICGIKSEDIALGAAKAGADYIGLVFATSPRQVLPNLAIKITTALKTNKAKTQTVGVFVNMPVLIVKKFTAACQLEWAQLSGDENWEYCHELAEPFIKVIKIHRYESVEWVDKLINEGNQMIGKNKYMFLLDTAAQDKYGGTGSTFDWQLAKPIAEKYPIIIAGGLNPDNVGGAIKTLKPWGVDVSTGVETNGVKDMKKIVKFIEAVRKADAM